MAALTRRQRIRRRLRRLRARRPQLRRRLRRLRAVVRWVRCETWFYNLDNHRPDAQVKAELEAIASLEPEVIALVEITGNRLPKLPGYTLVADRSRPSRNNIAAYVRADLPLRDHWWIDLDGTWPRTHGPGTHPARSYLVLLIGRMPLLIAHQPPKNARDAWILQHEGITALARAMAPWRRKDWRRSRTRAGRLLGKLRPRLLVWDSNRRSGEAGPGPDSLARRISGRVHGGNRIDNAVSTGDLHMVDVQKFDRVAGVQLKSDHKGAVRFRWRVRAYWI